MATKAKKKAPASGASAPAASATASHVVDALRILGQTVLLQKEDRERFDAACDAAEGKQ